MTKAKVIAVGSFPAWDQEAMRCAYDLIEVGNPDAILALDEATRKAPARAGGDRA